MNTKKAILFVPFYTPSSRERSEELRYVLGKNSCLSWLELIVLMIDDNTFTTEPLPNAKTIVYRTAGRPTYADWIALSAQHRAAAEFSICANADIELSIDFLENVIKEMSVSKSIFCITRYDLDDSGNPSLRLNPHWTQDTWCLTSDGVREVFDTFIDSLNIPFGTPRCDNKVPYVFWLRGWSLFNPCKRMITLHHHKQSARAYSKMDANILGSVAFVHPNASQFEPSKIDIDIFSLNSHDPGDIRHNKYLVSSKTMIDECLLPKQNLTLHRHIHKSLPPLRGHLVCRAAIDLAGWSICHSFTDRFKIYSKDQNLALVDEYWPSLWIYEDPGICEFNSQQINDLFLWGFCTPVTEFIPNQFTAEKLYPSQKHFWQYPCRTEQDAFERHAQILGISYSDNEVNTYLGLPWATWIDKREIPRELLRAFGDRFSAVRLFLASLGISLNVHTVCQHILWKQDESISSFELAGVNHLWIAHKEKGRDMVGQFYLHSWPLYAVNVLESERREGLEFVSVKDKSIFASFKGAHMKHYISDIRLQLRAFSHLKGYKIDVSDLWHFNKVVYDYQIANNDRFKAAIEKKEVNLYNQLLSQTLFSLCPGGAGPNTLRLWESLGVGSIPVVLSDRYEFPSLERMGLHNSSWLDAVIIVAESEVHQLPERLSRIKAQQRNLLQRKGQEFFAKSRLLTCFSEISNL